MAANSTNPRVFTNHDQVICTLFEGHYHIGFAALLNSVLRGGFSGLVYAGYRGELPPWTSKLRKIAADVFELPSGAQLAFEKLNPEAHFTNYKPDFMLELIRRGVATKFLWYFDPDITVRCSWKFFERWAGCGISLCEEAVNGLMPARHPLRCMWVETVRNAGWDEPRTTQTRYFNAGFVGLDVRYATFLERWREGIAIATAAGTDISLFMPGTREDTYYIVDQDSLNLSTMYATEPISAIGPEGMGFILGGFTMYHAVGVPKPWKRQFLRSTLGGVPPSNADKHFLRCADGPISPFTSWELQWKRGSAAVASVVGRFYRRT